MSPDQELYELANWACDGTITSQQRDRLEALLREQPAQRPIYLRYVRLHALLGWRYRTGASSGSPMEANLEPADEAASLRPSSSREVTLAINGGPLAARWLLRPGRWAYAATMIAILATAWFWRSRLGDEATLEAGREDRSRLIATLLGSSGAVWTTDGRAIDVGSRVAAEELRLDNGEAELIFDSGARLLFAGPARLTLESSLSVYLAEGKMAAHMPPSAIGFTVRTPTSTFVDQGTEFGVVAEPSGATEVHVFQGQVDLQYAAPGDANVLDQTLELADRQARRIEVRGGAGEDVSFSLSQFGNMPLRVAEPIEWKIAESGNGHFYQLVIETEPISWHQAARAAAGSFHRGRRGHLVSVTSAEEDQFVIDNLLMETSLRGVWMGMTDSLREANFRWVTGEPFEFSNWAHSPRRQPDNYREASWHGGEDYGMYADYVGDKQWAWNDLSVDSIQEKVSAYVIEYEPPVDALRHGSMSFDPIEWPVGAGGNGHFYQLVLALEPTDWTTTRERARSMSHGGLSGDLTALETEHELEFVRGQLLKVCGIPDVMIGLSGRLQGDGLRWSNGLPVEGIDVNLPHLPADEVYGILRWHFDHWEIQTRESSGYPGDWFGYVIEYAARPAAASASPPGSPPDGEL